MQGPYEARLIRVLDHIYDHPDGDLSLDRLADVAAMSRFHWHRVFHGMTGETCAQAVRRIRMHRAACLLVQSEASVAEVAASVGIPNVASFTRIFREGYGVTPAAFRNRGELRPVRLRQWKGECKMFEVEVKEMPERTLAAVPHRGAYYEIGKAFERLSAIMTARGLWPQVRGLLGVFYDDPHAVAQAELRSHAGAEIGGDVPEGMEKVTIPAGKCAVLHFRGPYSGLQAAYDYLYGEWLPKSGQEPRDVPCFEVYLNTPNDTAPDDLLTDVCLAVR